MSGKYADGSRMIIFWWGVRPTVRPVSFCFLLGVMPLANLPLPMGSLIRWRVTIAGTSDVHRG